MRLSFDSFAGVRRVTTKSAAKPLRIRAYVADTVLYENGEAVEPNDDGLQSIELSATQAAAFDAACGIDAAHPFGTVEALTAISEAGYIALPVGGHRGAPTQVGLSMADLIAAATAAAEAEAKPKSK